jgi:hypothetical protein
LAEARRLNPKLTVKSFPVPLPPIIVGGLGKAGLPEDRYNNPEGQSRSRRSYLAAHLRIPARSSATHRRRARRRAYCSRVDGSGRQAPSLVVSHSINAGCMPPPRRASTKASSSFQPQLRKLAGSKPRLQICDRAPQQIVDDLGTRRVSLFLAKLADGDNEVRRPGLVARGCFFLQVTKPIRRTPRAFRAFA